VSESNKKDPTSPNGNGGRPRRGLGGPSTPEGKEKTKFNAATHGIFSSVVVLKGEAPAEYESLLQGLWKDRQPQGRLEEILVEKLAMILWRHRRLLVSEGGEILKSYHCLIWDQRNQLQDAVTKGVYSSKSENDNGLFWDVANLKVLDHCLELLARLRDGIDGDELRSERDYDILNKIYGSTKRTHESGTLLDKYARQLELSEAPEDLVKRKGLPSAEDCRDEMLREIDIEMERLKQIREEHTVIQNKRTRLEMMRRRIPEGPVLERLLRYEASLERAFDRTMAQLERLQRIRFGLPVPPRIEVGVTS